MDETGRIVMSKREYVTRVVSPPTPGDFSNGSYSINPGLSGVFPFLSQVAANYDEYEFRHLVFHYKPTISRASQSGAMGSIVIACNYNAGSSKFGGYREMIEYMGAMECRICDEAVFGVECDPSKRAGKATEYVRTGMVPVGEDIKTYDLGLFQIATADISASDYPAGTLLGHLFVEYEVVLGKPKLFAALGKTILMDKFRSNSGLSAAVPLGVVIASDHNTLGCELDSALDRIIFPDNFQGTVLVKYYAEGAGIDLNLFVIGAGANITAQLSMNYGGTSDDETTVTAAAQAVCLMQLTVLPSSTADGNFVTVSTAAATSITGMSVTVCQINPAFADF
jgi:hypothetical protein